MTSRARGFTLIELLVVIAIIAILAAVLFPVFTRAREQGRISACASNQHQMFVALTMYCDEWGGVIPDSMPINFYPARQNMNEAPHPQQIHALLRKYVSSKDEVFRCPTDMIVPRLIAGSGGSRVFDQTDPRYEVCVYAKYGSSYQWRLGHAPDQVNSAPDGSGKTQDPISGQLMTAFRQPGQLGIARDAQPWHLYNRSHSRPDWKDPNQGGNVLYLDGHVKFVHGTEFLAGIY